MGTSARATVLYRCNGDQGEIVFASHVGHYKGCKVISGIDTAPRATRIRKSSAETISTTTLRDEPVVATPAAASGSVRAQPIPVAQV
ncbi:MAG: hypothetical protein M3R20_02970, partial [Pseudomonadota bacterium]|nr:hypothetical protein [Pseudomonadota bacterium]